MHRIKKNNYEPQQQYFEEIYNCYSTIIYDYIFQISRDSKLSEDISQDAFMKLWEKKDKLAEIKNIKSYLYTIAKHLFIDHLNKYKFQVERERSISVNLIEKNSPDVKYEESELNILKHNAILSLNEVAQNVYKLSREKSLTYQEISQKLGISKVAVKKQMMKALEVLRQKLNPHLDVNLMILLSFIVL
ncbi:MAG: RNA polymerase sigma factor [Cyclobacteriaceae bacterium]